MINIEMSLLSLKRILRRCVDIIGIAVIIITLSVHNGAAQPVGYGFVYDRPGSFGEMFKYTFSDRTITNRTSQGSDRKTEFGYGFALQWLVDGMMRDNTDPDMAAYLSRLNQLRAQFADLLLEGRFVDNEGFKSYVHKMIMESNISFSAYYQIIKSHY